MANAMNFNWHGPVDKRDVQGSAAKTMSGTTWTNIGDIAAARARLTAISGTTYPAAVLDKMTFNDMIYAIRVNDEAGSI
jgi:hypothetical protein